MSTCLRAVALQHAKASLRAVAGTSACEGMLHPWGLVSEPENNLLKSARSAGNNIEYYIVYSWLSSAVGGDPKAYPRENSREGNVPARNEVGPNDGNLPNRKINIPEK